MEDVDCDWLQSLQQLAAGQKAAMEPAAIVRKLSNASNSLCPKLGIKFIRRLLHKPRRYFIDAIDAAEII
eukprot:SAG31_NODE_22003_length_536_cov_0.647597_1_plen_69_part_10